MTEKPQTSKLPPGFWIICPVGLAVQLFFGLYAAFMGDVLWPGLVHLFAAAVIAFGMASAVRR